MNNLTVVCIVKNEAKKLPTFFNALKEFKRRGGSTLIVDTGSTDDTIAIAKKWGARVVEHKFDYCFADLGINENILREYVVDEEWEDFCKAFPDPINRKMFDFGGARKWAADQVRTDWVIMPDADEIITWNLDLVAKAILQPGISEQQRVHIYEFPFYQHGTTTARDKFFDRRSCEWKYRVHGSPKKRDGVESINEGSLDAKVLSMDHQQDESVSRGQYLLQQIANAYEYNYPRIYNNFKQELPTQHRFWFSREFAIQGFKLSGARFLKGVVDDHQIWDNERVEAANMLYRFYQSSDPEKAVNWLWRAAFIKPIRETYYHLIVHYGALNDKMTVRELLYIWLDDLKAEDTYLSDYSKSKLFQWPGINFYVYWAMYEHPSKVKFDWRGVSHSKLYERSLWHYHEFKKQFKYDIRTISDRKYFIYDPKG